MVSSDVENVAVDLRFNDDRHDTHRSPFNTGTCSSGGTDRCSSWLVNGSGVPSGTAGLQTTRLRVNFCDL